MAKMIYPSVGGVSKKTIAWYCSQLGLSKKVVKAYVGDSQDLSRCFWEGVAGLIIFFNKLFDHVPQGLNIEDNVAEGTTLSALATYFGTNKTLWVHEATINSLWGLSSDKCITSGYGDYENQLVNNSIYIPINQMTGQKLKITARGNLMFQPYYLDNGAMKGGNKGYICSNNFVVKDVDVSGMSAIDYIRLAAPDSYFADDPSIVNQYIYRPIPFTLNRIYTNNSSAYGLPGFEFEKTSGNDDVYFVVKYREPDGSQLHVYGFSKSAFTVKKTTRVYNNPVVDTINGTQIQSDPSVYMFEQEFYMWGYKFQNIEMWHTNYTGGWNTNWDKQVGQIVLYGSYNVLNGHDTQAEHELNQWITGFPQPIPVIDKDSCYLKYHTDYTDGGGTHHSWEYVGIKDVVGSGQKYFVVFYTYDSNNNITGVHIFVVSESPFTFKYWSAAGSGDTSEWGGPENCREVTYHNKKYYYDDAWVYFVAAQDEYLISAAPDGIDYDNVPSPYKSYGDLSYQGIWTMAYIIFDGTISGGGLQKIKKIEVIGGVESQVSPGSV